LTDYEAVTDGLFAALSDRQRRALKSILVTLIASNAGSEGVPAT
jgi:hypothetical protein